MSMTLEERADELCGNYLKFDSFVLHDSLDSAGNWCIVYTNNRDSHLLDESNADAIEKILAPFLDGDDIRAEHHNHWACGWIDGYAIRVYDDTGAITDTFRAWHGIQERLESYPVLDEDDYSRREWEATLENVAEAVRLASSRWDLDNVDASDVCTWLADNLPRALESSDDQGGYPSDDEIDEALTALGFLEEITQS